MPGLAKKTSNSNLSLADGIEFCDIEKGPTIEKFAKISAEWRVVGCGLNYEGRCVNKKCVAYNKYVWINRGYGRFDIARDIHRHAQCPMCDHMCLEVTNCGCSQTRWSFCGLPKIKHDYDEVSYNSKNPYVEVVMRGVSDDPTTFCKFDAAVNNLTTWAYLSVIVTPLEKSYWPLLSDRSSEDDWVDVVDEDTGECPVCMETMPFTSVMKLSCSHCICPTCFNKVNKCPLCRARIVKP